MLTFQHNFLSIAHIATSCSLSDWFTVDINCNQVHHKRRKPNCNYLIAWIRHVQAEQLQRIINTIVNGREHLVNAYVSCASNYSRYWNCVADAIHWLGRFNAIVFVPCATNCRASDIDGKND